MASSSFFDRFKRVTNSGRYLPEIDGLRFIGVVLVILFIHMGTYMHDEVLMKPDSPDDFIYHFVYEGGYGIALFFMVSGFILALPFAEEKLLEGKKVAIGPYFFRRLTRIEPAYIVSLTVYFILRVWVLKYESFSALFPHYAASFFYLHNTIYNAHSSVNAVAWTLEIEVQFYILAPLLSYVYFLSKISRRLLLSVIIIGGAIFSYQQQFVIGNIFNKGCYFMCGMLLADLYLLQKKNYDAKIYTFIGAGCFIASLFVPAYYVSVYYCVLKIVLTIIFFFFVISNATLKKWLSYKPATIIGGMCYSIYLVHEGILGLLRHRFAKIVFVDVSWLNATIHYVIAAFAILVVSSLFFLLIEKPTMRRDWFKSKNDLTKRN